LGEEAEFEDYTQKRLKKTKENEVELDPDIPIEDYVAQNFQNQKSASKESMSRAEMKSIGMNENGNDYIMRKIEELTSS